MSDISPDDAKATLDDLVNVAGRTKRVVARAESPFFILWGVVWILAFVLDQFMESMAPGVWPGLLRRVPIAQSVSTTVGGIIGGLLWLLIIGTGIVLTILLYRRMHIRAKSDRPVFAFWILLFLYVNLWLALIMPFVKVSGSEESARFLRHLTAIAATVPMFAYVVEGLWQEHFMIWIGLAVTGLIVLGLFLVPAYFSLWMAVFGGGLLLGTGLVTRKGWQ